MKTGTYIKLANCKLALIGLAAFVAATQNGKAAVVVNFGETVPTANIFASYAGTEDGNLGWLRTPDLNRVVSESVAIPLGSDFNLQKITMKLDATAPDFTSPSGFTIDFYQLTSASQNPETGVFLGTQIGTMQPTSATAPAGSYFSFVLDTPVLMQASGFYGFVLAYDSAQTYNLLRSTVDVADPAGTRAWMRNDGGAWQNTGATYTYYLEGTAVPEPATIGLLIAALGGLVVYRRSGKAKSACA